MFQSRYFLVDRIVAYIFKTSRIIPTYIFHFSCIAYITPAVCIWRCTQSARNWFSIMTDRFGSYSLFSNDTLESDSVYLIPFLIWQKRFEISAKVNELIMLYAKFEICEVMFYGNYHISSLIIANIIRKLKYFY